MFQQEVGGRTMSAEAAAGADQLDLEAAEQLIQLSGGDGADNGASESRSADSVKCRGADQAGVKEKEKEVESRRRRSGAGRSVARKDGHDGGEPERRSKDSVSKRSRAAGAEEKGKEEEPAVERHRGRSAARFLSRKDGAGVVDDGEERRRPRFRWLADIYRETRQLTTRDPRVAGGNVPPEAAERRKRKRVADADEEVVVPVVSKQSKEGTMAA